MSHWVALSRTAHADMHWWPRDGYRFAEGQQAIPILLAELTRLIPHYALAFIAQEKGYQPVVLTGLGGERNLYLNHDDRWLASYVPSILRAYPFSLAKSENDRQVLCIEQASLTEEGQGERLFDDDGNLAERVQQTLAFLNQCEQNRQTTREACQALTDAELIEPWPLQLEREEGQKPLDVQGLYRISEVALNGMQAEPFATLRQKGALALAYAQLLSMSQLSQLGERARFLANQQAAQPTPESLDSLFDGGDDDLIFDFDR